MTITEMQKSFIVAGVDDVEAYNWFYCVFTQQFTKLEICESVLETYTTEYLFVHKDGNNAFIGVDADITIEETFNEHCSLVYIIEKTPEVTEEDPA